MKRVLVVDDDVDILNLVKTILNMNRYSTETIANWQHLDNAIKNFDPALILLDISLSGANGLDICRDLKQNETTRDIPVILFSANVEMAKKVNECGASGYISKPFSIKELLEVIQRHAS